MQPRQFVAHATLLGMFYVPPRFASLVLLMLLKPPGIGLCFSAPELKLPCRFAHATLGVFYVPWCSKRFALRWCSCHRVGLIYVLCSFALSVALAAPWNVLCFKHVSPCTVAVGMFYVSVTLRLVLLMLLLPLSFDLCCSARLALCC